MTDIARRALALAALGALVAPGAPAGAEPLHPDPAAGPPRGPAAATGALVWLHAHYTEGEPPAAPPFLSRLTGAGCGWDLWRLDRPAGRGDPLEPGAAKLAEGTRALRQAGYRQVAVVGESRGGFIALTALRAPGLADALLAIAPAAHGTRPERRAEALAAFRAAMAAMAPGAIRRGGLVLFEADPYDPDPGARAAAFAAAMAAQRVPSLLIDRPPIPTGHGGVRDPAFDALHGARLAGFLAGMAAPARPATG
jgi:pimeloyl-ACP methyl ester carboxylesterase